VFLTSKIFYNFISCFTLKGKRVNVKKNGKSFKFRLNISVNLIPPVQFFDTFKIIVVIESRLNNLDFKIFLIIKIYIEILIFWFQSNNHCCCIEILIFWFQYNIHHRCLEYEVGFSLFFLIFYLLSINERDNMCELDFLNLEPMTIFLHTNPLPFKGKHLTRLINNHLVQGSIG